MVQLLLLYFWATRTDWSLHLSSLKDIGKSIPQQNRKKGLRFPIRGIKVSDAIASGGANTLGANTLGPALFPILFHIRSGKITFAQFVEFCKNIKESFNFTSCDQFLGIFRCLYGISSESKDWKC
jgi:hypothetical protein